jgi:hypothetical protein
MGEGDPAGHVHVCKLRATAHLRKRLCHSQGEADILSRLSLMLSTPTPPTQISLPAHAREVSRIGGQPSSLLASCVQSSVTCVSET